MATVVAIAYPDQDTAEQARATVRQGEEELITQADQVAVISRDPQGDYHVHTSHSGLSTAGGAIWRGLWGLPVRDAVPDPVRWMGDGRRLGGVVRCLCRE